MDKRPFVLVFLLSLQCHQQTDRLVQSVCARDEWVGSNTSTFRIKGGLGNDETNSETWSLKEKSILQNKVASE